MPLLNQNLDDKTFQELSDEARALIPRYAPEWTDHNLSDPGMTFMDLFGWLAEMQVYYLNRVTDKNRLKFLALLGEAPRAAQSAHVEVTFDLAKSDKESKVIPKGTPVEAIDLFTAERIIFETAEDLLVTTLKLKKALTRRHREWRDHTASNSQREVFYLPFGENSQGDEHFYLGFAGPSCFPQGEIKLTVNIFEADLSPAPEARAQECHAIFPSADLEWSYWNGRSWRPLALKDDTVALTRNGRLSFTAPQDFNHAPIQTAAESSPHVAEDLYWLRASLVKPGYEIPPRLDMILVNTVAATHGQTLPNEFAACNGLPFQSLRLRHKPVLQGTLRLEVLEEDEQWHDWNEAADFAASDPEARHYTIDLQEGVIRFGDGIHGRVPPAAKERSMNLKIATYRAGGGERGNVAAGAITEVRDADLKIKNCKPASGGREAESLEEAQIRVRRELKQPARAVTTPDFETLARQTPGLRIARVKVLPRYHAQYPQRKIPGAVAVVVVPKILPNALARPVPSAGFLRTIDHHLKSKVLATTDLHVMGPKFVEVKVQAKIKIQPRRRAEQVCEDVAKALCKFLDPLHGGADEQGWPFGRAVYKSEIYQVIESVPGVACVDSVAFTAPGSCSIQADKIVLPIIGLACSDKHDIVARYA